jgi:signal transduction histidine kinase/ActR/RegA family two-component response regulator
MAEKIARPDRRLTLRRRAEEVAMSAAGPVSSTPSGDEAQRVIHELRVHQIELEMQNEELRTAQEALDEARQRYLDLYELAPVGYCTINAKGLIAEANLTAASLFGVPRGQLLQRPFTRFILPADQDTYYRYCQRVTGSAAPAVGSLVDSADVPKAEPQFCELRMTNGGATTFWAQITTIVSQDSSGEPTKRTVIIDISERKRSEAEAVKLEAQLQQAQKMESIGRLAGGVAHDFNNMLCVILGHAEVGLQRIGPSLPVSADLAEILAAAQRSADLVRQLLAFARKQTIVPAVLDLNHAVAGMLKMLTRTIGEDIRLDWRPEDGLWPVRIDPGQLDQILANLCVNGRDAIGGVGTIAIATSNVTLTDELSEGAPGDYVRLSVSDDGCGMGEETQLHVFEPFFTTKGVGEGTGLGLATVYGALKQNAGFITCRSAPGAGATFTMFLPRHHCGPVEVRAEVTAPAAVRGHETILIVEDEASLLRLTATVLTRKGYVVLAARTPAEAIQIVANHAERIDLLLTDVVMPEMNGRDLARRLLTERPKMKCVFVSGYSADVIANSQIAGGLNFLQKPYSIAALAAKVRTTLDADPRT